MLIRLWVLCITFVSLVTNAAPVSAPCLQLPATPKLPQAARSGYAPIHGVKIWYAVFGKGQPVILLHGGLANSNYWGKQISLLAQHYSVIVMDSRGHGRSTRNKEPFSYHLMAKDVLGLMDFLAIKRAALVGWSDGGIIGIDIAIHNPDRINKLFAFAANSNPQGIRDISNNPLFVKYIERANNEYKKLSNTPSEYQTFLQEINAMWATQPAFTQEEMNSIKVPTWIVGARYDEMVKADNTEWMGNQIPQAHLLWLPNVSHFAFLQNPRQFNQSLRDFLRDV